MQDDGTAKPYDHQWLAWFEEHKREEWATQVGECASAEEAEELATAALQGTGSQSVSYNLMTYMTAMIFIAARLVSDEDQQDDVGDMVRRISDTMPDDIDLNAPPTNVMDSGVRAQLTPPAHQFSLLAPNAQRKKRRGNSPRRESGPRKRWQSWRHFDFVGCAFRPCTRS